MDATAIEDRQFRICIGEVTRESVISIIVHPVPMSLV
jgi:hypothetical protein